MANASQEQAVALLTQLRQYEAQLQDGQQQLQMMRQAVERAQTTIDALKALPQSKNALFTLGSGVMVKASVEDADKVLVEVGAGVVIERTSKEAIEFLTDRAKEAQEASQQVESAVNALAQRMDSLAAQIRTIQESAQRG